MAPLSGTDPRHLGGFRILTLLAEGGMGRVYLALGPDRRAVALKVARPEIAADARFRARFRREVATARGVGGEGGEGGGASLIAPIVAADADAELPWLASEYVPGPSVTDAAMEFGPLGEPGLRTLTHGLALALTEVHATGVVHRDVKPSNVLLARDGPRLIDFGVARAIDDVSLTRVGALIGSPGFLSPEQAVGDMATFGSDIFAMASVVAYAARGQSPFGAGDGPALLYRVVHEPPKLDGIPADLAEVLAACLAKNPAERPTAQELAARVAPAEAWLPEAVLDDIARREAELNAWLEVTAADPSWGRAAEEAQQSAAGFDTVADSALDIANARMSEPWHAGTRRRDAEPGDEAEEVAGPQSSAGQTGRPDHVATTKPRPTSPTERRTPADRLRQSRPPRTSGLDTGSAPGPSSPAAPESPTGRLRQPRPPRTSGTDAGSASAAPEPPAEHLRRLDLPRRSPGRDSRSGREAPTDGIRQPGLPRSSAGPSAAPSAAPAAPGRSSQAERASMSGQIREPGLPRSSAVPAGAEPDLGPAAKPGAAYAAFLLDPHSAPHVEPHFDRHSDPHSGPGPAAPLTAHHRAPRRRRFPVYAALGALLGAAVAIAVLLLSPTGHSAPAPSQSPDNPAATTATATAPAATTATATATAKAKAAPPTSSGGGSGLEQRGGTTSASGSRR